MGYTCHLKMIGLLSMIFFFSFLSPTLKKLNLALIVVGVSESIILVLILVFFSFIKVLFIFNLIF